MGYWGKIIGGIAGFAMGGPPGAAAGIMLGHLADQRNRRRVQGPPLTSAQLAALLGRRDQLFAISVTVLAAKLAKCDGVVKRSEIDAFKRYCRISPQAVHDVGRLFDQARENPQDFEEFARQLGESFADNRGLLEEVLAALFAVARADGVVNGQEADFLARTHQLFGLGQAAWQRAQVGSGGRAAAPVEDDPYAVLGVAHAASDEEIHQAWKKLMREHHPDSLAARGVPAEFIARASEKVARLNAAWDRIKRERRM